MRQHIDLGHVAMAAEIVEQIVEGVAGKGGALLVVGIGAQRYLYARGPSEQNRYHRSLGVVHDLREAVDRVVETIIKTMHEHHDPAASGLLGVGGEGRLESWLVEMIGRERH